MTPSIEPSDVPSEEVAEEEAVEEEAVEHHHQSHYKPFNQYHAPTMYGQWENSQKTSTETELKGKTSSKNAKDISYSMKMYQASTPPRRKFNSS
jgi:hypothetical protein